MQALVEIVDVTKTYGRTKVRALDGVTLTIPQRQIFGLLGPNGAGKSTLLAVLLGLARKDAGTVRIAGLDLDRERMPIRRMCGLAPQELGFYPTLSVAENLQFYAAAAGLRGAKRQSRVAFATDRAQLAEHLSCPAQTLSGGLKRRLNLALSLVHAPQVLFLDEPTAGVDPQSRAFILDVIRQLRDDGATIVYTSHYMDEVQQLCDRVAILDHGRILVDDEVPTLLAGGRRLHLQLAQAPAAAACEALAQFGVQCDGRDLSADTAQPLALQAALQPVLAQHALEVSAVHYGHQTLEDVFLQLTHRRLRE